MWASPGPTENNEGLMRRASHRRSLTTRYPQATTYSSPCPQPPTPPGPRPHPRSIETSREMTNNLTQVFVEIKTCEAASWSVVDRPAWLENITKWSHKHGIADSTEGDTKRKKEEEEKRKSSLPGLRRLCGWVFVATTSRRKNKQ